MNLNKKFRYGLCGYSWKKSTVQRKCTRISSNRDKNHLQSLFFTILYTLISWKIARHGERNAIFNKMSWKIVHIVLQLI